MTLDPSAVDGLLEGRDLEPIADTVSITDEVCEIRCGLIGAYAGLPSHYIWLANQRDQVENSIHG